MRDVPAEGGKAIMLVLQCDLDYQWCDMHFYVFLYTT